VLGKTTGNKRLIKKEETRTGPKLCSNTRSICVLQMHVKEYSGSII